MTEEADKIRAELEENYGEVLDTKAMTEKYTVEGFSAPYVVVTRKEDGQRGSLVFNHMPRFYYGFMEHKQENRNGR